MALKTIDVELGDTTYTITQLPAIKSRPWRERLMTEVKPIFEQISTANEVTINNAADLLVLMPLAETLIVEAADTIIDMVFEYAPELEADREAIMNTASEQQLVGAFYKMVELIDPFGVVRTLKRSGLRSIPTT